MAHLKYRLDHLELLTPDPDILEDAFRLVSISTDTFDDEKQREAALKPILQTLLSGRAFGGSAVSDATWLEGPFTYLIFELKNEEGLRGDPFLQGLLAYGKVVAQPTVCSLSFLIQLALH